MFAKREGICYTVLSGTAYPISVIGRNKLWHLNYILNLALQGTSHRR